MVSERLRGGLGRGPRQTLMRADPLMAAPEMASLDLYLKLVATAVTATFALLLVPATRDRPARLLAVFFALIAANQGIEAFRSLAGPSQQLMGFRLASITAAADPFVLMLFVYALGRGPAVSTGRLLLFGVPAALLALWAGWGVTTLPGPSRASQVFPLFLGGYTAIVYLSLYLRVYREVRDDVAGLVPRYLLPGLAIAAIPSLGRAMQTLFFFASEDTQTSHDAFLGFLTATTLLTLATAFVLGAHARRHLGPGRATPVLWGLAVAAGLVLAAEAYSVTLLLANLGIIPVRPETLVLGRVGSAIRWILFAWLASMALFRGDILRMGLAARRRATRILIGVIFLCAALGGLLVARAVLPQAEPLLGAGELLVLLVAVGLSQSATRLLDRVAFRLYGVPLPGDHATAHVLYQQAAVAVVADGREPGRDAGLQRLRDELGIDKAHAGLIERSAEAAARIPLAPGQLVGQRYRILELLGRGGMGRAFLAEDTLLQRRVAIKEILAVDDEDGARAMQEARAAAVVQHPAIVGIFDVVPRGGAILLVTEYVGGGTLAQRLRESPVDVAQAEALFRSVVEAVASLHERGLIHCDIKAENVLLTTDGRAKLADFGIARPTHGATRAFGAAFAGTPETMAPEQRLHGTVSPASDVYALGVLGRRLFPRAAPPATEQVLLRALQEEPSARWPDARKMLEGMRGSDDQQR